MVLIVNVIHETSTCLTLFTVTFYSLTLSTNDSLSSFSILYIFVCLFAFIFLPLKDKDDQHGTCLNVSANEWEKSRETVSHSLYSFNCVNCVKLF